MHWKEGEKVPQMVQRSSISLEKLGTFFLNDCYACSGLSQPFQIPFLHFLQTSIHLLYFSCVTLLCLGFSLPAFTLSSLGAINISDYLIHNITF